jgi:hypothetical protein
MLSIVDNEHVKISAIENRSDYVTLCFTGIGHGIGGIDVQSDEFLRASNAATAIFVVDKARSWGNNIDFSMIRNVVASFGSGKTVNAIGNSMGGYLAILSSKFIEISSVVSIVPQYSVSKQVIPSESRWDRYVNEIRDWRYTSIGDCFSRRTKYYILAGYGGADDKHLVLMPTHKNIYKIYFKNPRFLHNVAQALKEDGALYPLISDCFSGKNAAEIIDRNLSSRDYGAFTPGPEI